MRIAMEDATTIEGEAEIVSPEPERTYTLEDYRNDPDLIMPESLKPPKPEPAPKPEPPYNPDFEDPLEDLDGLEIDDIPEPEPKPQYEPKKKKFRRM